MRYGFGKNWEQFIRLHFNAERVDIARQNLLDFLGMESLEGKTFLDVGCGSGLPALAAQAAGARQVVSFDLDPISVATSEKVRELHGNPENWTILEGSILDRDFISGLEQADIVYAWGVLHHTGDQWKALENTASLVLPGGVLFLAMYTSGDFIGLPDEFWMDVKYRYNCAGFFKKRLIEYWYLMRFFILQDLRYRTNPFKRMWEYKKSRGMHFWTDQKDWLGGWPMQFSTIAEVDAFCTEKLDFTRTNITTGQANTEYLFKKKFPG